MTKIRRLRVLGRSTVAQVKARRATHLVRGLKERGLGAAGKLIRVVARSSTLSCSERTIVAATSSSYWTTLKKKLRTTNLIRIKIRAQLRVS